MAVVHQEKQDRSFYEIDAVEAFWNTGEALRALENDHRYLTESGVFPDGLVPAYAKYKYEHEHMALRSRPHPYEMKLYFET